MADCGLNMADCGLSTSGLTMRNDVAITDGSGQVIAIRIGVPAIRRGHWYPDQLREAVEKLREAIGTTMTQKGRPRGNFTSVTDGHTMSNGTQVCTAILRLSLS
jgi:hypothetical protein